MLYSSLYVCMPVNFMKKTPLDEDVENATHSVIAVKKPVILPVRSKIYLFQMASYEMADLISGGECS